MSQAPRQHDGNDGLTSGDQVAQRPRTGGRVAGQAYAPPAPATAGSGYAWPFRDYSGVEPRPLREAYQWWQAIARDVADRRRARRWEQGDVADAAGVALNTVQRIERGEWVAAHNLFLVCSVLGLRIEQIVEVADPRPPSPTDRAARRGLARPATHDRVATREEVLAGRAVLSALARHHELTEPRVDLNGTVYVRAARTGDFSPLWRFSTVLAQTLGVWVNVSADQGEANRQEAELL
ncbi:helix-turn-helix domain-containing protein [Modestobacter sp. VKM Ac-2984]|uniref:helix-turn-helix domain-containing protein n=1 Tax=Modestobacter sp. VKM Ac-2984 TaxID=3004138 RepID=UPI0022AAE86B|nr:helix-turn-helix transcriptional regulator [Modestobacter sp. VKM Ac-2984]MCZ2818036.1 helix-turn-helix transcriptional regulator [Modestobacter sp. VKM Ac-2984]